MSETQPVTGFSEAALLLGPGLLALIYAEMHVGGLDRAGRAVATTGADFVLFGRQPG